MGYRYSGGMRDRSDSMMGGAGAATGIAALSLGVVYGGFALLGGLFRMMGHSFNSVNGEEEKMYEMGAFYTGFFCLVFAFMGRTSWAVAMAVMAFIWMGTATKMLRRSEYTRLNVGYKKFWWTLGWAACIFTALFAIRTLFGGFSMDDLLTTIFVVAMMCTLSVCLLTRLVVLLRRKPHHWFALSDASPEDKLILKDKEFFAHYKQIHSDRSTEIFGILLIMVFVILQFVDVRGNYDSVWEAVEAFEMFLN